MTFEEWRRADVDGLGTMMIRYSRPFLESVARKL